jgi:hypothetical protein
VREILKWVWSGRCVPLQPILLLVADVWCIIAGCCREIELSTLGTRHCFRQEMCLPSFEYYEKWLLRKRIQWNTRSWHLRVEQAVTIVSSATGLLSSVPTSRNTRLKPSIEAWWRRPRRWRDVNFKCSKRSWRSVVVNKSCRLNKPSWRLYESRWNPAIGAFLFFSQLSFIGFFFFFSSFFFFVSCLMTRSVIKNYIDLLFPLRA